MAKVDVVRIEVVEALPKEADAIAVGLFEKTSAVPAHLKGMDAALGGAIGRAVALGDFKGKAGSVATMAVEGGLKRLMLVGLGKREGFDLDNVRWAAGSVARSE